MTIEHPSPSLPHAPDRRPAVWPWLLMPLVALTLYLTLHSVRESAPPSHAESPSQATQADGSSAEP